MGWRRDGGGRLNVQISPAVQADANQPDATNLSPVKSSLLTGRLRDETGDRLTPTHTVKNGRRIRYYVSSRLTQGGSGRTQGEKNDGHRSGWRLPAPALETAVAEAVAGQLEAAAHACALLAHPTAAGALAITERARFLATVLRSAEEGPASNPPGEASGQIWPQLPHGGRRDPLLRALVQEVRITEGALGITLDADALAAQLGTSQADLSSTLLSLNAPFGLRRRGVELRLVAGSAQPSPDPKLVSALAKAHRWAAEMRRGISLAEIAGRESTSEPYISSRTRLAFLSPALQTAIMNGTQPTQLTLDRIVRTGVPLDWIEQAQVFGLHA